MRRKKSKQAKFAKNAYKKQPAMLVYTKDYITSTKLRRSGLEAAGLWSYFMFQTSLTDNPKDYGIFRHSHVDESVKKLLESLLEKKHEQDFEFASNLLKDLLLQKTTFCSTFEDIFGWSKEKFALPLCRLLMAEVCKLDDRLYLYSSRMVRDADISEKRARAGSQGGKKTQSRLKQETKNPLPDVPEFASEFAKSKGVASVANANANAHPYNNSIYNGVNFDETPQQIKDWYIKTTEEVKQKGISEKTFNDWKDFVTLVSGNTVYRSAFAAKFVYPLAFEALVKKGFTREKWQPVLNKLSGLGIKPEQNLEFRIVDAMSWSSTFAGGEKQTSQDSGVNDDMKKRIFDAYTRTLENMKARNAISTAKYDWVKANLKPGVDIEALMKGYEIQKE